MGYLKNELGLKFVVNINFPVCLLNMNFLNYPKLSIFSFSKGGRLTILRLSFLIYNDTLKTCK